MDQRKTGALISAARKEKSLTQKQLAEKLGITDKSISKWERGISFPDVSIVEELCQLLNLSVSELFAGRREDE